MSIAPIVRKPGSLLASLFVCTGCLGTETGNPSETRDVSMAMVLNSSDTGTVQCGTQSEFENIAPVTPSVRIVDAWLATDHVDIHACTSSDVGAIGASAWDLLHPAAHVVTTSDASFCGFDFRTRLGDLSLGAIPNELSDTSIWLRAVRLDGVPVEIRTPVILTVSKEDASTPLTSSRLVIALDAAGWLANINFGSLQPAADGVVHVTPTSNAVELRVFEQQTSTDVLLRTEEAGDDVIDR